MAQGVQAGAAPHLTPIARAGLGSRHGWAIAGGQQAHRLPAMAEHKLHAVPRLLQPEQWVAHSRWWVAPLGRLALAVRCPCLGPGLAPRHGQRLYPTHSPADRPPSSCSTPPAALHPCSTTPPHPHPLTRGMASLMMLSISSFSRCTGGGQAVMPWAGPGAGGQGMIGQCQCQSRCLPGIGHATHLCQDGCH